MKRLQSFVLTLVLLSSSALSVNAESNTVHITIDGQEKSYDQSPIILNDFTLVPLRGIFESLGAQVEWKNEEQKITATKDETIITLNIGSKTGFVNGKPVNLDLEARIIDGRTMVPLRFISETVGATVKWDGKTKTVQITTGNRQESESKANDQGNSANSDLTVAQAVELAVNYSNDLKTAQATIKQADKSLESAADEIDFIPSNGGNADATKAFTGFNKAQTDYFMSKKQFELAKESLDYSVRKAYNDILTKKEEKSIADLSLEDKASKKRIVEIKAESGLASDFDESQATHTYKDAVVKQETAAKALEDAYVNLNQLIGWKHDARYNLVERPEFEKFKEEVDLETHISQVTSGSTSIWLAEQKIKLAQLDVDYFSFGGTHDGINYDKKKIDVEKAQFAAADTKQQIEANIRTIYSSIKKLETQYEGIQASLNHAEESLKVLQAKYNVGMVTAAELLEAKLGLEQVKQQIFNITVQLDTLKIAYDKPWVMGG